MLPKTLSFLVSTTCCLHSPSWTCFTKKCSSCNLQTVRLLVQNNLDEFQISSFTNYSVEDGICCWLNLLLLWYHQFLLHDLVLTHLLHYIQDTSISGNSHPWAASKLQLSSQVTGFPWATAPSGSGTPYMQGKNYELTLTQHQCHHNHLLFYQKKPWPYPLRFF